MCKYFQLFMLNTLNALAQYMGRTILKLELTHNEGSGAMLQQLGCSLGIELAVIGSEAAW
jgi:hypothetical protein